MILWHPKHDASGYPTSQKGGLSRLRLDLQV